MTESAIEAHLASIASSMATLVEENQDLRQRLDVALERIDRAAEVERNRVDADRRRTRWYRITVVVGAVIALTFGGVLLDNQRAIRASEQRWCPVLGLLSSGPASSTTRGEWIRDVFSQQFSDYGCTPADLDDIPDAPTPSPSPAQT